MQARMVSFDVFLLDLQRATLLLPLYLVFSVFTYLPGFSLCVLISSYKSTSQIGFRPTLET